MCYVFRLILLPGAGIWAQIWRNYTIANCVGIPKMLSKSRLSLSFTKMITLKDKRFSLEKYKIGRQAAAHTNKSVLLRCSKYVDNKWNCGLGYIKSWVLKIFSQGKNQKLGKIIKKPCYLRMEPIIVDYNSVIRALITIKTLVNVILLAVSKHKKFKDKRFQNAFF